jgi:hypothetical protein
VGADLLAQFLNGASTTRLYAVYEKGKLSAVLELAH